MSIYAPVKAQTELGEEKRCMACGEYWPADQEFFQVMRSSRDGLTPRCIACIKDKLWQMARRRPEHADYGFRIACSIPSEHVLAIMNGPQLAAGQASYFQESN